MSSTGRGLTSKCLLLFDIAFGYHPLYIYLYSNSSSYQSYIFSSAFFFLHVLCLMFIIFLLENSSSFFCLISPSVILLFTCTYTPPLHHTSHISFSFFFSLSLSFSFPSPCSFLDVYSLNLGGLILRIYKLSDLNCCF